MSLTAYIRYDSQGRIVPGGPIVTQNKPTVGNWQVVTEGTSVTRVGQLRAFVKLDRYNKPLAGSLFLGKSKPATGKWIEINATYEGAVAPTTSTTTSTTTSALYQSFDVYLQNIYIYPDANINLFAGSDVVTTIYIPVGQVFGAPGTIAYIDSALTIPLSNNINVPLYVQRVEDDLIYTFTDVFSGSPQQIPHFSGTSKNIPSALAYTSTDGLVTRIINGPNAGAINLTTGITIPYIALTDTLQVGTQLYNSNSLTTPLTPGLTFFILPIVRTATLSQRTGNGARAYQVDGNTGIITAVLELASTYFFNQWDGTKTKDTFGPCNTFSPNGVITAPSVTSFQVGDTVLQNFNSGTRTWDPISSYWQYLNYDNTVYSLSNGLITAEQPCS